MTFVRLAPRWWAGKTRGLSLTARPSMRIPVLIVALCLGPLASAATPTSVAEAQATQKDVVEKLESDRYDHVKRGHREKIAQAQQALAALPADGGPDQLARAVALVEEIDELMEDAELDRQVCHRERPMGSNRMVKVCRTQRQMNAEAESLRNNGAMRSRSCGYTNCD